MACYIFHRHSVYLVDHVNLICSCTGDEKVLGLLPQPHCSWVSVVVICQVLSPEVALEGLGLPLVRARCGSGAAAPVSGVLAAPGTQWGWWLGQQEIECSRRVWQPVLANTLQYACLENPSDREVWQATVQGQLRVGQDGSDALCINTRLFFSFLCL